MWLAAQYTNVDGCNFTHNTAEFGGALAFDQGNNKILNSKFVENSANTTGGAIYNGQWGNNVILNTTFLRNTARDGGAVYTGTDNGNVIEFFEFLKKCGTF